MSSSRRLLTAYLGVGFVIAIIENWSAHVRSGSSVLEVLASAMSFGQKMQTFIDLVMIPIFAWPIRVWTMLKGG